MKRRSISRTPTAATRTSLKDSTWSRFRRVHRPAQRLGRGTLGNTAIANSGANLQGSGSQLNGTLQIAGSGASGGWAGATGIIALALAGDATAGAQNTSSSSNFQEVSSTLTTGDATAQNFTGVTAAQSNDNSGNAGALEALAFVGIAVGAIVQTNVADVTSLGNDAVANTGANAQIGGFQGNGTVQGAGAVAESGWAGALGGLAIAVAGDASAAATNSATSVNEGSVTNDATTGAAEASNIQNVTLKQTNTNAGWAAGLAILDLVAIGAGGIIQYNGGVRLQLQRVARQQRRERPRRSRPGQPDPSGCGGRRLGQRGHLARRPRRCGRWRRFGVCIERRQQLQHADGHQQPRDWRRDGPQLTVLDLTQSNTNNGDGPFDGDAAGIAALSGIGIGVALIYQGNSAVMYHDANSALANTGDNAQFSGPQVNITGQLALAGAEGGGALRARTARGRCPRWRRRGRSRQHGVELELAAGPNDLLTGVAMAVKGIVVLASQTNTNTGDAAGLVLGCYPAVAASPIVQENQLSVTQEANTAVANSGLNSQTAGGQLNATVQIAAMRAKPGRREPEPSSGAVAVDGDPTAGCVNDATSENTTDASNTMATGNVILRTNQLQVDVTQENDNEGDAIAVGL